MFELTFKFKYRIGDVVYVRSDLEGRVRFITGYIVREKQVVYIVSLEGQEGYFFWFELEGENERLIGNN